MNNDVHGHKTIRRLQVARPAPPLRGHLPFGEEPGTSDRIEVTSTWIERDGQPWFPITGEVHYSRIPRSRWDEVLAKAAAGGLNSIATYVIWQVHEPFQGEFHWDDNRDLRSFIKLCAQHGLDVIVRMGPWTHGEARYGGFPDWLVQLGIPTRTNDPQYLELTKALYAQIIAQLEGLTHREGGPVVGVQMDNEIYDNSEHLATLRVIAEGLGLRVPLWTATGWGGAQVPETLFPLYSAYSEGFWEETTVEWPEFASYHYRYSEVRDDLTVGKDLREALDGIVLEPEKVPLKDDSVIPFATCELGGGMHVAYHRRPLVTSDDVSKLALTKIGSGSIWQGYYMYAGGTIRKGPHGTEQESHATGYPNDVPTLNYDFYAPLGQHAQVRKHYHQLRRQHLWLTEDGRELAAMRTAIGGGSSDPTELRWATRTNGLRGYLFATTYQPAKRPLAPQSSVQFAIEFEDTTVTVPTEPIDLPAGISVAWPLRYAVAPQLTLRSATADILTRVSDDQGEILVLAATDGIVPELVFEGVHAVEGAGRVEVHASTTVVTLEAQPSPQVLLSVSGHRILVLDEASSLATFKLNFGGQERLVRSSAPIYVDGENLIVHPEHRVTEIAFLPPMPTSARINARTRFDSQTTQVENSEPQGSDGWGTWTLTCDEAGSYVLVENLTLEADYEPAATIGGPMNRLSAPTDFSRAAHLRVDISRDCLEDVDRALLRVHWSGDVARAIVGEEVIADQFWYGREWDIDLTAHASVITESGLTLQLLPWSKDLGIWVDPAVRGIEDGIKVTKAEVVRIPKITISVE